MDNEIINKEMHSSAMLPPQRFIYGKEDLQNFYLSSVRRDLLAFAAAMGRSCNTGKPFDNQNPLSDLSPAMAVLYGSLEEMCGWIIEIPPDKEVKARFGNPSFRKWHQRLLDRSSLILGAVIDAHLMSEYETSISLEDAKLMGMNAAKGLSTPSATQLSDDDKTRRDEVCLECTAYFQACFGHPVRLDYGTGHESSFLIMIFSLFKAGCFEPTNPVKLRAVTLAVFGKYIKVCRGLQMEYMLEPAGSHGVWGLDDYHALPFYFGACQLTNNPQGFEPNSIHDDSTLEQYHNEYMYFGCIRYIKVSFWLSINFILHYLKCDFQFIQEIKNWCSIL